MRENARKYLSMNLQHLRQMPKKAASEQDALLEEASRKAESSIFCACGSRRVTHNGNGTTAR